MGNFFFKFGGKKDRAITDPALDVVILYHGDMYFLDWLGCMCMGCMCMCNWVFLYPFREQEGPAIYTSTERNPSLTRSTIVQTLYNWDRGQSVPEGWVWCQSVTQPWPVPQGERSVRRFSESRGRIVRSLVFRGHQGLLHDRWRGRGTQAGGEPRA